MYVYVRLRCTFDGLKCTFDVRLWPFLALRPLNIVASSFINLKDFISLYEISSFVEDDKTTLHFDLLKGIFCVAK